MVVRKASRGCASEGREHGWAFALVDGSLALSSDYNALFIQYLKLVQHETKLIAGDEDID